MANIFRATYMGPKSEKYDQKTVKTLIGYFSDIEKAKPACINFMQREFHDNTIILNWSEKIKGQSYKTKFLEEEYIAKRTEAIAHDRSGYTFEILEYELDTVVLALDIREI